MMSEPKTVVQNSFGRSRLIHYLLQQYCGVCKSADLVEKNVFGFKSEEEIQNYILSGNGKERFGLLPTLDVDRIFVKLDGTEMCKQYKNKLTYCNGGCNKFHLCDFSLWDNCTYKDCRYFHKLKNEYNRNIVKKLDLGDVDDVDILLYLKLLGFIKMKIANLTAVRPKVDELRRESNSQNKHSESGSTQINKKLGDSKFPARSQQLPNIQISQSITSEEKGNNRASVTQSENQKRSMTLKKSELRTENVEKKKRPVMEDFQSRHNMNLFSAFALGENVVFKALQITSAISPAEHKKPTSHPLTQSRDKDAVNSSKLTSGCGTHGGPKTGESNTKTLQSKRESDNKGKEHKQASYKKSTKSNPGYFTSQKEEKKDKESKRREESEKKGRESEKGSDTEQRQLIMGKSKEENGEMERKRSKPERVEATKDGNKINGIISQERESKQSKESDKKVGSDAQKSDSKQSNAHDKRFGSDAQHRESKQTRKVTKRKKILNIQTKIKNKSPNSNIATRKESQNKSIMKGKLNANKRQKKQKIHLTMDWTKITCALKKKTRKRKRSPTKNAR